MTQDAQTQTVPPAEAEPATDVAVAAIEAPGGETLEAEGGPALEAPPEGEAAGGPAGASNGIVLHLQQFDGPLDLLLHLIEQRDLDITEVSLLAVTEQYLTQLRSAETINMGALSDFVAVGARLLLLKSRALLPREDEAPEENAEEDAADPEALLAALQEYRRYKQAADYLRALQDEHRVGYRRAAAPPELPLPTGLEGTTVERLAHLLRGVLERLPVEETRPAVRREPIRLRDRIARLVGRLDVAGQASFLDLIGESQTRVEVVVDFLAVLELIKARYLEATQDEAFGDIRLVRLRGAPTATFVAAQAELDGDFTGT